MHRGRALPVRGAQTVGTGVAAADDDDALALGRNQLVGWNLVAIAGLVLLREILHREMHTRQFAARQLQVARRAGAAGEHDGIEILFQLLDRHVQTDVGMGLEHHAFGFHLLPAPVAGFLFEFELGNAVAQQTADAVVAFEHGDGVADAPELLRARETGGAGPDDRDLLAGFFRGWLRLDPALVPGMVDDRELDGLDRHRIVVDAEHARALAWRRTNGAGEFREIIGRVQPLDGFRPLVAVHQVVPVGNDVAERATLVAERNAAVHAARALLFQFVVGERQHYLAPVAHALGDRAIRLLRPLEFHEAGSLTHAPPPSLPGPRARRSGAPWRWPRARACNPWGWPGRTSAAWPSSCRAASAPPSSRCASRGGA